MDFSSYAKNVDTVLFTYQGYYPEVVSQLEQLRVTIPQVYGIKVLLNVKPQFHHLCIVEGGDYFHEVVFKDGCNSVMRFIEGSKLDNLKL